MRAISDEERNGMKFSTRTRCGMRVLVGLAREWEGEPCSVRQMAAQEGISAKYLEHIMTQLRRAKLVRAVPGHGYRLTKPPGAIRINRVVWLLEGSKHVTPCRVGGRPCQRSRRCVTRRLWQHVEQCVDECLSKATLADLCRANGKCK